MAVLQRFDGSAALVTHLAAPYLLSHARFHRRQTCRRPRLRAGAPVRMTAESCATDTDVAIIGGGPAGLATAASFASAFGSSLKIKVTERLTDRSARQSQSLCTSMYLPLLWQWSNEACNIPLLQRREFTIQRHSNNSTCLQAAYVINNCDPSHLVCGCRCTRLRALTSLRALSLPWLSTASTLWKPYTQICLQGKILSSSCAALPFWITATVYSSSEAFVLLTTSFNGLLRTRLHEFDQKYRHS